MSLVSAVIPVTILKHLFIHSVYIYVGPTMCEALDIHQQRKQTQSLSSWHLDFNEVRQQ